MNELSGIRIVMNPDIRPTGHVVVKLKETGLLVALDRKQDFNPRLHEYLKEEKPVNAPAGQLTGELPEAPVDPQRKLYFALRLKGTRRTPEEEVAYEELKQIYGKNK